MKTRGFTLIELLAVIVILAVIALIATPIILGIIEDTKKSAFKDSAYGISQSAKNAFVEIMYAGGEPKDITYRYTNGVISSSPSGYTLNFEGQVPKNGEINLNTQGQVSIILHDGKYCATKGFNDAEVTIEELSYEDCMPQIVDQSGANAPVLATGMTAVMWDGANWVAATNIDNIYKQNWYDYEDQKWANAVTSDCTTPGDYNTCSMWVWIPRYAYQITSGYHSSTTGTIDVKFLQGITNTTIDSTTVYEDNSTNTHFVQHPAFTFGTTELTGMWVAKFEMSGTTSSLDCKPGVASLRNITLGAMFTASRNMETNSKYGWALASGLNADGTFTNNTNNVDTHMIKSIEWGAVAYLSKSIYGKNNEEIYINNSQTFTTGCAGNTVSALPYNGCQNAYNTATGFKASTAGTIYGIYDMSGGATEFVMGNFGDRASSSGLTPASLNGKYIDRYTAYDSTKYGDAIYETSSTTTGQNAWYLDHSHFFSSTYPWFFRNGTYDNNTDAGPFNFDPDTGTSYIHVSWRTVVLVGTGL